MVEPEPAKKYRLRLPNTDFLWHWSDKNNFQFLLREGRSVSHGMERIPNEWSNQVSQILSKDLFWLELATSANRWNPTILCKNK